MARRSASEKCDSSRNDVRVRKRFAAEAADKATQPVRSSYCWSVSSDLKWVGRTDRPSCRRWANAQELSRPKDFVARMDRLPMTSRCPALEVTAAAPAGEKKTGRREVVGAEGQGGNWLECGVGRPAAPREGHRVQVKIDGNEGQAQVAQRWPAGRGRLRASSPLPRPGRRMAS